MEYEFQADVKLLFLVFLAEIGVLLKYNAILSIGWFCVVIFESLSIKYIKSNYSRYELQ